jgi:hypothetical protein
MIRKIKRFFRDLFMRLKGQQRRPDVPPDAERGRIYTVKRRTPIDPTKFGGVEAGPLVEMTATVTRKDGSVEVYTATENVIAND